MTKTYEEYAAERAEWARAVVKAFDDWMAHQLWQLSLHPAFGVTPTDLQWRLSDRPVRDFVAWVCAQGVNPLPLPGELTAAPAVSAHEPCDAECGEQFGRGRERCRHLRTPEESLRGR
jgi:hypothetical protein